MALREEGPWKIEWHRHMMVDRRVEDHPASIRDIQAAGLPSEPWLGRVEPSIVSWTTGMIGLWPRTGEGSMASRACLPETAAIRRRGTACRHEVG